MHLGYSVTSRAPLSAAPADVADRLLARAELAEAAGFDSVECGDHHVQGDSHYLQNLPTMARLAGVFDHVACMVLVPLYHPVLVAEQIGTIGAFADRVDMWCAIGYGRAAFEAFDVPFGERVPRFLEGLELMRALWSGESVTFDGEFHSVTDVSINPRASPRVCVGGGAEPAVRRAGAVGDAWVAAPSEEPSALEEKVGWFEDAGGGTVIARRDVLALEDGDRARSLADDLLAAGYRGWPADSTAPIAGDAGDVASALEDLEALGVDEVVVRPMSDEHAEATLETVADARA